MISITNDGKQRRLLSSKCAALYHDKRTQESSDGLFFTEENTRRVSVKKLPSRDVSDAMSRHQKPLLVFLSLSFWPRSNKSQRSVKQRDNAIKAAKEKRKAAEANKAAARKAMPKVQSKAQAKMPKAPKMKGSGGKR